MCHVTPIEKLALSGYFWALGEAIAKGDKDAARKALNTAASAVDKGVQEGVLHKNTASRYKSQLNAKAIAAK